MGYITVSVNTAVSGAAPFTYRGTNGSTNKIIHGAAVHVPGADWITAVQVYTGTYEGKFTSFISVYANGSGTLPVRYIYTDYTE